MYQMESRLKGYEIGFRTKTLVNNLHSLVDGSLKFREKCASSRCICLSFSAMLRPSENLVPMSHLLSGLSGTVYLLTIICQC